MKNNNYLDQRENCGFLDLGFDILAIVFVEAKNLELATVSKLLYQVAHNTGVQLECYSCWKHDHKCPSDPFYIERRIWLKNEFVSQIIKKYPFNDIYNHLYVKSLEKNNMDMIEICSNYHLKNTVTKKIFEMIENSHKIQINFNEIFPGSNSEKNLSLSIHSPLTKETYLCFLESFALEKNLEMIKYILPKIHLNQESFNRCFYSSVKSKNLEIVKQIFEYGTRFENKLPCFALQYSFENGTYDIVKYVFQITQNIRIDDNKVLNNAVKYNNSCLVKHLLEKVDLKEQCIYQLVKLAINWYCSDVLIILVDKVDLSELDTETQKKLVNTTNLNLIEKILGLGIDIHLDNDRILKNCVYQYCGNCKIFELIKKILVTDKYMYQNNSKYIDPLTKRYPEMEKLVFECTRKQTPLQ
ncbi:hypothetical protein BB558_003776 [Smittium angustum]|uniref:Uncharacterized protein n=1 Tax=Smittium angustum TaxID=133377 RepID=A0A2U1J571_SMIAN|nr:hypothetical protein BB558_003776 [Smittium angustum]